MEVFKLTSQNILAPRKFHHAVWESIAVGYGSPLWRLSAMAYRSMLPQIARLASVPADVGDPDTLADRLVPAVVAVRAHSFKTSILRLGHSIVTGHNRLDVAFGSISASCRTVATEGLRPTTERHAGWAWFGSLPPDSFLGGRVPATGKMGHERT